MTRYEELMTRHEMIRAAWMGAVPADGSVFGTGIALLKDGTLTITGRHAVTRAALFDLVAAPGAGRVTRIDA